MLKLNLDQIRFVYRCKKYDDFWIKSHDIHNGYFQADITIELKRKLLSKVIKRSRTD